MTCCSIVCPSCWFGYGHFFFRPHSGHETRPRFVGQRHRGAANMVRCQARLIFFFFFNESCHIESCSGATGASTSPFAAGRIFPFCQLERHRVEPGAVRTRHVDDFTLASPASNKVYNLAMLALILPSSCSPRHVKEVTLEATQPDEKSAAQIHCIIRFGPPVLPPRTQYKKDKNSSHGPQLPPFGTCLSPDDAKLANILQGTAYSPAWLARMLDRSRFRNGPRPRTT